LSCRRALEKRGTVDGRRDSTRAAIEEPHAEFGFEVLDALAEGGLGDVDGVGGTQHVALLGDGQQMARLAKVHVATSRAHYSEQAYLYQKFPLDRHISRAR
jgi:hypothetical protein